MKTIRTIIISIAIIIGANGHLLAQNPKIQDIVNSVSGDSIFRNIANLQELERYTEDNDTACVNYIRKYIEKFDIDTIYLQHYTVGWLPNIIAVKYGTEYRDSIYILGAHYDSYASGAPGADDNASGTSGVLETIRLLSNHDFKKTIIFILFSGEELGMYGSRAFAENAASNNTKISGMINLDMIAFLNEGDSLSVSVSINHSSIDFANIVINSAALYVPGFPCVIDSTSGFVAASDHSSFWEYDIPALNLEDEVDYSTGNYNPNVHTDNDTIGVSVNCKELSELITKTVVASMIELAKIEFPLPTSNIKINSNVSIYPNPTSSFITINQQQEDKTNIEIYNTYGQRISSVTTSNKKEKIDLSNYPNGLYFIKLSSIKYSKTVKILKK